MGLYGRKRAKRISYDEPPRCPEHDCLCHVADVKAQIKIWTCPFETCAYRLTIERRFGPRHVPRIPDEGS